ncbi:MAG: alkaline phosphatase family protein, partial [Peptococcaceae bacterium]|nr:alkaline phosphatase family protein [Peptococcaceae bacterium]
MSKKRAMMLGLDGADPFIIKKLIADGRMPNMKRVLEEGTANPNLSMLGAFPSVTPPNWASLATGNWPRTHGITCYDNHTLGKDLGIGEMNWDSRRVESELIWETFAKENKRCIMMNYCEAWPPRVLDDKNIFIDGTGVVPFMRSVIDYQKVVWMEKGDFPIEERLHEVKNSTADCVITGDQFEEMAKSGKLENTDSLFGPVVEHDLKIVAPFKRARPVEEADNIRTPLKAPENWARELPEDALVAVVPLNNSLVRRYFVLTGDTITIYKNRREDSDILGVVKKGEWSEQIKDLYMKNDEPVNVIYRVRWLAEASTNEKIKIYISSAQNMDDLRYTYPQDMGRKMFDAVGSPCGFAKYGQTETADWEGNNVLLESFRENINWHSRATHWLFNEYPDWDLYYIHLHAIDLYNHWYINRCIPGSDPYWENYLELLYGVYEAHDAYIGEMLKYMDENTSIFVCSDHAAVPNSVGDINPGIAGIPGLFYGVMEELGFTKTYTDENGKTQIDWSQTKAVSQRSSYIYINLKGRDPQGIVEPEDFEKTIDEVISALYNYRHPHTGKRVVAFCMTREEMEIVGMGGEH